MKLKDIMLIALALVIYTREDNTNKTVTSLKASNTMNGTTSSLLTSRCTSSTPEVGGQPTTVVPININFTKSKQSSENLESNHGDNQIQSKQSPENQESNDGDNKTQSKQWPEQLESSHGDNKTQSKQWSENLESNDGDNKTQSKQWPEHLESNDGDNKTQSKQWPEHLESNDGDNKTQSKQWPEHLESSHGDNKTQSKQWPLHLCSVSKSVFNIATSSQMFTTAWQTLIMLATTTTDIGDRCSQLVAHISRSYQSSMNGSDEWQMSANQSLHSNSPKLPVIMCQQSDFSNNESGLGTYVLSLHFNKITVNFTKTLKKLIENMLNFDENVSRIVITNTHNLTQDTNIKNSCNPKAKTDFILLEHEDNVYFVVNFPQIKICYPLTRNGYKLEIVVDTSHGRSLQYKEMVYLCAVSDLFFKSNCRISSFNLNETSQIGSGLKIVTIEQYFGEDDYEILGDKVFVCIKSPNTPKNVKYLLTSFIFSSVSIICLALMIFIHYLFQELRNLSGKMNTSLAWKTLFLVVLNLLSLLDVSHKYVCPVLAVFTHAIILAHFGWVSAMAVHMALSFCHRCGTLIKSTSDEQMFIRYNLIVWGLSIVIVTPCVVLDFTHPDEDLTSGLGIDTHDRAVNTSMVSFVDLPESSAYPRYGFPFCTWFSGAMWTRLSFIIVPYFVSYTVSLAGFVFTLLGLHRSSNNPETIGTGSSAKSQCIIYIILSTDMNLTLISYILASLYPDVDILIYVYTWLVLSQGVFIFMAFTMNKKVLSLISKFWINSQILQKL